MQLASSLKSSIESKYIDLTPTRNQFLDKAKDFAKFTLPYIMPDTMPRAGGANQHGFQGIGAQAVNHLANKLAITIFPPQRPFYALELTDEAEAALITEGQDKTQIASMLTKIVKRADKLQATLGFRPAVVETFKQLIISGNVCFYVPKRGKSVAIPLSNYVIDRDSDGELLCLITLSEKVLSTFDKDMQLLIKATSKTKLSPDSKIKLYTKIAPLEGTELYEVTQAAGTVNIGKPMTVRRDECPWIVLRWNSCYGESYGRGLVEDHSGDFFVIEFLSRAIARGMALMADVKYLVKPGSVTDINHLIESPTGEFVVGNIDDIGILQLEKYADFTPISAVLEEYKRRIGQAFMLQSANRRDAERVTTLELRIDANELETSLGGVYSLLTETFQKPLAYVFLSKLEGGLGSGVVSPNILTGLDALGKSGDLEKINEYMTIMSNTGNLPEPLQRRINWGKFDTTIKTNLGLDSDWMYTEAELQSQEASQTASNAEGLIAGEAAKAVPDLIKQQMGVTNGSK